MRKLVPHYIEELVPYKAGRPIAEVQKELGLADVIKLASNENPFGPSPKAVQAAAASLSKIHRYPAIGGTEMREKLAERFALKTENVIIGSGSEGIMANIVRTFLDDDDEVVTSEGTFVGIYVLVKSRGVKLRQVPLRDYRYDLHALADAINDNTKIIYLANPNNPTGNYFTRDEFEQFYARVPQHVLIILDEAYFEFARLLPDYPDSMQYRYDNVITLRTFSKAYGLAGLRIGYGFAEKHLIGNLLKVKLPFEPSIPAQAAGMSAMDDYQFLEQVLANNHVEMDVLVTAMKESGYTVLPSATNFIMIVLNNAEEVLQLTDFMLHQGVIVRSLAPFGLPHCLRVTIGLPEENQRFFNVLQHFSQE